MTQPGKALESRLETAASARTALLDARHEGAVRLFNGFSEGYPAMVVDVYARTAVIHNYAERPAAGEADLAAANRFIQTRLPWVECIVVKTRNASSPQERAGRIIFGSTPADRVLENGVWYALDLLLNRDASLYLDTRNVRLWALRNLASKSVLNAFAYTGSLGVAAQAGGAARVVQLDRNRSFLNIAKRSYTLNGLPIDKKDFQVADFWARINQFKRDGSRFDCVFLDPPFFATSPKGTVDLQENGARLINKVRPLINDGGFLVAINNALFVSGRAYLATLEALCADGYVSIEEFIPVPEDFTGFPETRAGEPPSDPAPFNHTTKIALLRIRRKQQGRQEADE